MAAPLSSKIEFKSLCNLFEKIQKATGVKKYEELQKFTHNCRVLGKRLKDENPETVREKKLT